MENIEPKLKATPKDFFIHLLSVITLYIVAVAFGRLLFQYIDFYLPDPLSYNTIQGFFFSIRFAMASLIIGVPVFLGVRYFIKYDFAKNPEKLELRIRHWLTYFTVFGTAVIIIGSLISIVYTFLGGEITTRFVLKVLSVLYISGLIFSFYLRDIREKKNLSFSKVFASIVGISALAALIAGFFIIGSPAKQRDYQFDEQRLQALESIRYEIINYFKTNQSLPANLSYLSQSSSYFALPLDPETDQAYEYALTGSDSFELCATFGQDKPASLYPSKDFYAGGITNFYSQNFSQGRSCFDYTLTKEDQRIYDLNGNPIPVKVPSPLVLPAAIETAPATR